jgi:two-component system, OmpR family, osmolarity sensor histidine kinase EnvZ
VNHRPTLFRRTAWSIGAGLLVFQLLAGLGIFSYVLLPLVERSADDLAALLVLSARTWVELPPETRPAFESELASSHGLELRAEASPAGNDIGHHHPYMTYLRAALMRRADPGTLPRVTESEDDRFHADIPMGGRNLRFSFAADRIDLRPLTTLLVTLVAGTIVAVGLAWWLARRVSAPVRQLAIAARQIGAGEQPAELPESGERELAAVARIFNQTAAQLAAQRENQNTLLAGISHDLRSPLTRLRMALGMLAEECESPLIDRMEADVAAMEVLIAAQLQLARAREREPAQPTDIDSLLAELVEGIEPADAGAGAVQLRAEGGPCVIDVARVALRRVLANLIDNAAAHGGRRGFAVVRRRCGEAIAIGVRDRGPGIAKELRETVFRPYFRIEPSRNRETGGSGLGLAIARQLADTHGWRLAVKAHVGGGASFWLAIPSDPRR